MALVQWSRLCTSRICAARPIAQEDQAINAELERFYAKRMGAKTTEIKSSHVPFISHPKEVARLIEQVASAAVVK